MNGSREFVQGLAAFEIDLHSNFTKEIQHRWDPFEHQRRPFETANRMKRVTSGFGLALFALVPAVFFARVHSGLRCARMVCSATENKDFMPS